MASGYAADHAAESFQGLLLGHRGRTSLTQRELAARMGMSARTVENWEGGVNYPSAKPLRALIAALLESGGLTIGREAAEAEALWTAALRSASRMHTPFDQTWFADLLVRRAASRGSDATQDRATMPTLEAAAPSEMPERREDWGDAPDVFGFLGRIQELATLQRWVVEEHCRLVVILGLGGIGKTTLAAQLAAQVAPSFERVFWRSVRNAPSVSEWLGSAIGFLSDQKLTLPEREPARLALLLELLRERSCLLALDNFETLLMAGQYVGQYREGYAGYATVLHALSEGRHQSCLLLTSRESPPELGALGSPPVERTLELGGLDVPEGRALLADKHLTGDERAWGSLVARYGGNGLALRLVGESIRQVFAGDLNAFLEQGGSGAVFGSIRRLLDEQVERSSGLERQLLTRLAIEREPVTSAELLADLGSHIGRGARLEVIEALLNRSLVELAPPGAAFTLQSVVLEYLTDRMVAARGPRW